MTERILIKRIGPGKTQTGKSIINLFANSIQKYPELVLFELSELLVVGIDPATVTEEQPARFWCYFEISDKMKSTGTPYRDVVRLEPVDLPATSTAVDTSALLSAIRDLVGEVRAIKALLLNQTADDREPEPSEETSNVDALSKALPGVEIRTLDNGEALVHFNALAANALVNGLPQSTIDAIKADIAGLHGFSLAAECLAAEMQRKPDSHRVAIIARLGELLDNPLVTTGQVEAGEAGLEPGWQWKLSKAELIKAGKRIKAAIEAVGQNN